MAFCNTTLEDQQASHEPLSIGITFHHLGLILSAAAGLIAVFIAGSMIFQHATHYSKPGEQKHIIRILFMIPVYSIVSFLSYLNYHHAIYFQVIRDCYEAFAIASFFTLLCNYIAPSLHDQKDYFRGIKSKNWLLPVSWLQKCTGGQEKGIFRRPMSGLTWFNVVYLFIFQYCFIRVLFTIVAVSTQALGRYCSASLSPAFAHIWVLVFEGVSVSFAMYGLIQFYYQTKQELAEKKPFLKLLCIKLVIFFCFWQTLLIDFLTSARGPLQPTEKFAYPDLQVGIPSMLICLEMAIFAALHIFAFSTKPYKLNQNSDQLYAKPTNGSYNNAGPMHSNGNGYGSQSGKGARYEGGPFGVWAFADAFNPWDILKATARGFKWLFIGSRTRRSDPSYSHHGESGWHTGAAFDAPDPYDKNGGVGGASGGYAQGLQNFSRPVGFNGIPLRGGPLKYAPGATSAPRSMGPYQGRPTASRMQSQATDEDEDVWASGDYDDDDLGRGRGQRGQRDGNRDSFEVGAEDRAGLLRSSAGMGIGARIGVSPGRSDISDSRSPERNEGRRSESRRGDGGRSRSPLPGASGAPGRSRDAGREMSAFDKEAGIESQYVGYGRNSWGRDQRPGG